MARIEEHMKDCYELLGDTWEEVHRFLDQYAGIFPVMVFEEYHRSFLHNKYGLEIIGAMWGPQAKAAAVIHLVRDYSEMPVRSWKSVDRHLNKALMYFNSMERLEPHLNPSIISGWDGNSLVSIAFEEEN